MLQELVIEALMSTIGAVLIVVIFYEIFFFSPICLFHAHNFINKPAPRSLPNVPSTTYR